MLKRSEYVPYAPDYPGVTRINHESPYCSGDSKSMRVERRADGSIHAKCFRCGASGSDIISVGTVVSIKATSRADAGTDAASVPHSLGKIIEDPCEWPVKAYVWLRHYGITNEEIRNYQIGYSVEQQRVILPIWWKGEKVGYQLRRIFDTDNRPKYITKAKGGVGFMSFGCTPIDKVVLVEDILSAIKVGRQEQAIALLSTGVTQEMKLALAKYNRFYIWLDMDNEQVVRAAVKLVKSLGIYGVTKLLHTPNDPKEYDDDQIERYLYAT